MSPQTFLLYVATWALVALTPGPAVMCSLAQATRHGFRFSLAGIAGIQLVNFLFFVGIALGLDAMLATTTTAFSVFRVVGALYLFYLGVRIMVSSFRRSFANAPEPAISLAAHRSLFLQGLLIQLTNPKALLFVSALLPQFIEPQRSVPLQLLILGLATVVIDTVVLSLYAFLAERGVRSFRVSRWSAWLERVFGAGLLYFGIRLLLSRK